MDELLNKVKGEQGWLLAFWHLGNMDMLTGERSHQRSLRVFQPQRIKADIALAIGRFNADMSSTLDPTADILHQLNEGIEAIRLHAQRSVEHDPKRVPAGKGFVVTQPLIVCNGLGLAFWHD